MNTGNPGMNTGNQKTGTGREVTVTVYNETIYSLYPNRVSFYCSGKGCNIRLTHKSPKRSSFDEENRLALDSKIYESLLGCNGLREMVFYIQIQ